MFSSLGTSRESNVPASRFRTWKPSARSATNIPARYMKRRSGKIRRKHAYMHTLDTPGINAQRVGVLNDKWTWVPPLVAPNQAEVLEGLEDISLEELDAAFAGVAQEVTDETDGDGLDETIDVAQVYDLAKVQAGVVPLSADEETSVYSDKGEAAEIWDSESLMLALGL